MADKITRGESMIDEMNRESKSKGYPKYCENPTIFAVSISGRVNMFRICLNEMIYPDNAQI